MKEVQSHVVTESSTAALGREKQPRDCSRGKRARAQIKVVSLSSANGGVTLQIQTWFREPFTPIKLCST